MTPASRLTGGLVAVLLLAACAGPGAEAGAGVGGSPSGHVSSSGGSSSGGQGDVATLTEEGVQVRLRWSPAGGPTPVLEATFTPLQQGFHLYSIDLPPGGVGGVGRPTTLEVGGGLAAMGPPQADRRTAPLAVAGVAAPVPVYPDGPVTLRLPVRVTGGRSGLAWVGYASCSRSTCMPPVTRREVRLTLPGTP